MNKPLMVLRQEFIDGLTESINSSGLSVLIIEPILKELWEESKRTMRAQYDLERRQYEEWLNENEEDVE